MSLESRKGTTRRTSPRRSPRLSLIPTIKEVPMSLLSSEVLEPKEANASKPLSHSTFWTEDREDASAGNSIGRKGGNTKQNSTKTPPLINSAAKDRRAPPIQPAPAPTSPSPSHSPQRPKHTPIKIMSSYIRPRGPESVSPRHPSCASLPPGWNDVHDRFIAYLATHAPLNEEGKKPRHEEKRERWSADQIVELLKERFPRLGGIKVGMVEKRLALLDERGDNNYFKIPYCAYKYESWGKGI